jgi:hypothetical protein
MVREKFPDVRLIVNMDNRGFAGANNQGFAESTGRYVLMLNPDTSVCDGAIETLATFMDTHPDAGVCGGKLLYPDGTLQHSAFHFPTLAQIFLDLFPLNRRLTDSRINGRYPRTAYAHGKAFRVDHPLGADFMVRRQAAEQVGWLDERFLFTVKRLIGQFVSSEQGGDGVCPKRKSFIMKLKALDSFAINRSQVSGVRAFSYSTSITRACFGSQPRGWSVWDYGPWRGKRARGQKDWLPKRNCDRDWRHIAQ